MSRASEEISLSTFLSKIPCYSDSVAVNCT